MEDTLDIRVDCVGVGANGAAILVKPVNLYVRIEKHGDASTVVKPITCPYITADHKCLLGKKLNSAAKMHSCRFTFVHPWNEEEDEEWELPVQLAKAFAHLNIPTKDAPEEIHPQEKFFQ